MKYIAIILALFASIVAADPQISIQGNFCHAPWDATNTNNDGTQYLSQNWVSAVKLMGQGAGEYAGFHKYRLVVRCEDGVKQ